MVHCVYMKSVIEQGLCQEFTYDKMLFKTVTNFASDENVTSTNVDKLKLRHTR